MSGRLNPLVWVKQVLNLLIVLCIPLGLFFAWGKVNNEISYKYEVQGPDYREKQTSGDWTPNDRRIMDNIEFHGKAARFTLYAFAALLLIRVGLSMVRGHSMK